MIFVPAAKPLLWGASITGSVKPSCAREWAGSGSDAIANPNLTAVRNHYGVSPHSSTARTATPRHWRAGIGQHWNGPCLRYVADRKSLDRRKD